MLRFQCINASEGVTNNKLKIYICSHPDDGDMINKEIYQDILSVRDCAVFYDSDPSGEWDDDLYSDLSQMRLCVVGVTKRFLTEPSVAKDKILPYFKEQIIPILPIIFEDGLDELFAKTFSDSHYLTRGVSDGYAISYEEKLEKYLSVIFCDDSLTEKIQAAFDAYVFISYRKIDRRFADKLMRLIHKDDLCRDIAIWYDEFLTPGESFNEAIYEAIAHCDLFAMAVTPNIVQEGNYIIDKEYPYAKKKNKGILPVEFLPTDESLLSKRFDGIPKCVIPDDDSGFTTALLNSLKSHALRKNKDDPMHDFLIGLAYLNGIDVEIDTKRAVQLIASAAKRGLPQAIEKLVNMYCIGQAVDHSFEKAAKWQNKLINIYKEKYKEEEINPHYEEGPAYVHALIRQGEIYEDQMMYNEALPFYKKARSIASTINLYDESNEQLLSYAALLLARTYLKLDSMKGYIFFGESMLYSKFPDDFDNRDDDFYAFYRHWMSLMIIICENSYNSSSKIDEATEGYIEQNLPTFEMLYKGTGLDYDRDIYAKALLLGAKYNNRSKKKDKAIEKSELVLSLTPDDSRLSQTMRIAKAEALINLADKYHTPDTEEQRKLVLQAMGYLDKNSKSNEILEARGACHSLLYFIDMKQERLDEAKINITEAKKIFGTLAKKTHFASHYEIKILNDYLYDIFPKAMGQSEDPMRYTNYMFNAWTRIRRKYPKDKLIKAKYKKALFAKILMPILLFIDKQLEKKKEKATKDQENT